MTPTKLLIGQIIVVFTIVIIGVWASTQWCAVMLGYQAQLGAPWGLLFGLPIYAPWKLFDWWYHYEAYAPHVFDKAGMLAGASGFMGCAAAIVGSLWRARQSRLVTTYGSSRWATAKEVKRAGLFDPCGVFLGRFGADYLRHSGPEHVMAFAPTRSGKGVGLVVPTLLSWTGSAVIHDIKGENWLLTAGWRSTFSHALLFNPTDPRSARYNPLLEVRKGLNEVRDVQNIADILVDPEGALEKRSHWEKTSHSLLVGAILHILYAEEDKTLARVATFLSDPQRSFAHTLRRMMSTNHLGAPDNPQVHPVVASAAREVLNKSENERSGVLSTAMSFLGLYRDPTVALTTSACDWRITDLMDGKHPVSLYLVIPPSDISRTKPLVRLVLNQIGRRLTERLEGDPKKSRKHNLLMMLDEFPALGRLDFFETALAFMAGYGIRAYLIAQSLNQISKAYGENNAILDNCHVRIAFSSNDERTAKRISDALGTATELRAQRNYAGHRLAPWLSHVMVSRQETARPLLTPGEVMQLPPSDELVLVSGLLPIRAKKLRYYEDANFTGRVLPAPTLATDTYADKPAQRPDDWSGQIRGIDDRLIPSDEDGKSSYGSDEGGLQQQRHPGLPEETASDAKEPEQGDLFHSLDDDTDTAADKNVMDSVVESFLLREGLPKNPTIVSAPYIYFETLEQVESLKHVNFIRSESWDITHLANLVDLNNADALYIDPLANLGTLHEIDFRKLARTLECREWSDRWLVIDGTMVSGGFDPFKLFTMPNHPKILYFESGSKYLQFGLDLQMAGVVVCDREKSATMTRHRRNLGAVMYQNAATRFPRYDRDLFLQRMGRLTSNAEQMCEALDQYDPEKQKIEIAYPRNWKSLGWSHGGGVVSVTMKDAGLNNRHCLDYLIDLLMKECATNDVSFTKGVSFGFSTTRVSAAAAMADNMPPFLRFSIGEEDPSDIKKVCNAVTKSLDKFFDVFSPKTPALAIHAPVQHKKLVA